jgi:parvulin-like peptidyl-prolyl isomerase
MLTLLLLVSACSRTPEDTSRKELVSINGVVYTSGDIWDYANIVLWEIDPDDLRSEAIKNKIFLDFIEHKLMLAEAEKREIVAEHDEQDNQLYTQLASKTGAQELKALTGHYDIDAAKVARLAEERLIIDELCQQIIANMDNITDEELRKYYQTKLAASDQTGVAHISHIFITDEAQAQSAMQELQEGIIFSEVARKYAEGPEKQAGGDLGFIKESDYPEFFADAFKLKNGETSGIVKSDYGYHIFRMTQRADASRIAFDNVKQELHDELYIERRQEMIREFVNALLNNADIKYLNNFTLAELFPQKPKS